MIPLYMDNDNAIMIYRIWHSATCFNMTWSKLTNLQGENERLCMDGQPDHLVLLPHILFFPVPSHLPLGILADINKNLGAIPQ